MIGRCDDSVEGWHDGSLGRKRSCKRDRRANRAEDESDIREPLHEANHQPLQSQQPNLTRTRPEMSPLRARGAHDFAPFPKRVSPSRISGTATLTAHADREPERERRRERMQRHRRQPRRRPSRVTAKENDPCAQYYDKCEIPLDFRFECDSATDQLPDVSKFAEEPMRTNIFSELCSRDRDEPTRSFYGDENTHEKLVNDFYTMTNNDAEFSVAKPEFERMKKNFSPNETFYDLHPVTAKILNRRSDRDRSPSPLPKPISPNKAPHIDLSTLHEQLGPTEPVRSMPTKLSAFPWRPDTEEIMEPLIKSRHMSPKNHHIDSYVPESIMGNMTVVFNKVCKQRDNIDAKDGGFPHDHNQDDKTEKLNSKIQSVKRKLLKYESEFEQSNGYRISQADKMNHPVLSKLYSELHQLKLDKKRIQSNANEAVTFERKRPVKEIWDDCDISFANNKTMAELVADIEIWVQQKASSGCAGGMSGIAAEKAALQVALLRLEAARGRPGKAGPERPIARPLYDRYRTLKRMLKSEERNENTPISGPVGELETILEHEALLFTTTSIDSSSDSQERQSDDTDEKDDKAANRTAPSRTESEEASSSAKSTASEEMQASESQASYAITNESLHCLPYEELSKLLADARVLKTNLRATIRTNEIDFEIKNGRKLLKDERLDIEQDYIKYKEIKARVRLLTALVNKHKKMVVD